MTDAEKTKQQLIDELVAARERIAELENRERAALARADAASLFHSLLEGLPHNIFSKNVDGQFTFANQSYCKTASQSLTEILGKSDFDLHPRELAEKYREDDRKIMASGRSFETVEEHQPVGGEKSYVRVIKTPIYDHQGEVSGIMGIFWDVTAEKRAEEERDRLQLELIAAQEEAIRELSTPIIPLLERILVMPLIGAIDTSRARDFMRALLAGISRHRAKVVILDITGVPVVDSGVAAHLDKAIQAARLKGAHVIITGISDAVAAAIVDLGIDWSGVETQRDLQTGLIIALHNMNLELRKRQP